MYCCKFIKYLIWNSTGTNFQMNLFWLQNLEKYNIDKKSGRCYVWILFLTSMILIHYPEELFIILFPWLYCISTYSHRECEHLQKNGRRVALLFLTISRPEIIFRSSNSFKSICITKLHYSWKTDYNFVVFNHYFQFRFSAIFAQLIWI